MAVPKRFKLKKKKIKSKIYHSYNSFKNKDILIWIYKKISINNKDVV